MIRIHLVKNLFIICGVIFFINCPSVVLAQNQNKIIAHWDFNEISDDTVIDKSNNNNDCLILGGNYVSIKNGFALNFDGVDDYINCGNTQDFNFNENPFSIELLIKPNSLKKSVSILTKDGAREYAIRVGGGGAGYGDKIIMFINGWNNFLYSKEKALIKGYWTHIVYVKNGSNIDCYIDGQLNNQSGNRMPSYVGGPANLLIGGANGYGFFNGLIDDIKIYNYALNSSDINVIYQNLSMSTRKKNIVKSIAKFFKLSIIILIIIFIGLMRIFWTKENKHKKN